MLGSFWLTFQSPSQQQRINTNRKLDCQRHINLRKKRNHFKRVIQPAVVGESGLWDNFIQAALAQKDMVDHWRRAQSSSEAPGVVVRRMMPSLWAARARKRESQIGNIIILSIYVFLQVCVQSRYSMISVKTDYRFYFFSCASFSKLASDQELHRQRKGLGYVANQEVVSSSYISYFSTIVWREASDHII